MLENEIESYFKEKDYAERSKKERVGKELIDRITTEDDNLGGVFLEITGSQGSGKTSVMLALLLYFIQKFPKDKCFWSSTYNAPLQFTKLGDGLYNIMVREGSGVEFKNRVDGEIVELPVTYFTDFDDLWNKAKPGTCNAVFFGDRYMWLDMLFFLRSKYEWAHIFFDEFGEVASSDQSGKMWKRIRKFSEDIKEVRKCNKNVFFNTQSATDVDYRVRKKLMVRVFLPGSRVDGKTRIFQSAVDNLVKDPVNGNMAYIDKDGEFGITRFKNIFKPIPGKNWEAIVVKKEKVKHASTNEVETRTNDTYRYSEGSDGIAQVS